MKKEREKEIGVSLLRQFNNFHNIAIMIFSEEDKQIQEKLTAEFLIA